jgi:uroporphyrinogen decarboxylase
MTEIKNDLLLRVLRGEKVERPPVWMMRQAGRILPEYREVRAHMGSFKKLVETPAKASEVTLQPVDLLGVDAAIIFSDILVIPEAMNLPYEMLKGEGPNFVKTIASAEDLLRLDYGENAANRLQYVYDAIIQTKRDLAGRVPLIGFAGAPWTILAYMVEGGGSKTFSKAKKFLYQHPKAAHDLLNMVTETTILYLKNQIKAGADVIQIFDSWAALLGPEQYREFSFPYIQRIGEAIGEVPTIVFPKGAWFALEDFKDTSFNALSLDWLVSPHYAKKITEGKLVLQGNLDPCRLYDSADHIAKDTIRMMREFGEGHIVNLGHGVYPDTPLEGVRAFIDTVKSYKY